MSETLDLCIDEINRSIESISTLYFKPPGIFHNAVVRNNNGQGYSKIITQLIRDCNPKEELSLFEISKTSGVPSRKDGKESVVDFLAEREINIRRNRRVGLPNPKPIITVPKEFYLRRHDETLRNKRRKPNVLYFDVDNTNAANDSNVFRSLLSKFNGTQIINLLHALQNGSVIMETPVDDQETEQLGATRQKTIFLDDFPTDAMLKVFEEVVNQWPLAEYKQAYTKYLQESETLKLEIDTLKAELQLQDEELQAQLQMTQSSSNVVGKLIDKEKKDIRALEEEINKIQAEREVSSDK